MSADAQARMYQDDAHGYDALIEAEDHAGTLRTLLVDCLAVKDRVIADVGGGTGRLTRWFAPLARHVHLIEPAAAMRMRAERQLARDGLAERVTFYDAGAEDLPLEDKSVDVVVAGWVLGHFRDWYPEDWRSRIDIALTEMRRIQRPGGRMALIETLGTGATQPQHHPRLEEYFAHLTEVHGMQRAWCRTDYVFATVDAAATATGRFFGVAFEERVRAAGTGRVPECTAVFFSADS